MTPASFRTWRRRLSLTQLEAATALGVSTDTIGRYENGATTINRAVALACAAIALGVKPHE